MFKTPYGSFLVLACLLLLFGCGADETVNSPQTNTPLAENGATDVATAPASSPYYPITLGNRWTYRNPDGSQWSRQVAVSEVFDAERYHSFSYEPAATLDSLGAAEYLTYADRFVRRINLSEIDDIVWEVILESSGGPTRWPMDFTCGGVVGEKLVCETNKNLFRPRIMTLLYRAKSNVIWHSKLTLLQYPLLPSQTHNALEFRITGDNSEGAAGRYRYDFKAEGSILGKTAADWKSVQTPAGSFEKCLKIHYEPELKSFTLVDFQDVDPFPGDELYLDVIRELFQSELIEELNDLLTDSIPKLGLRTMWLAPGVGPVKIETPNGIAELVDYEMKPEDLYRTR